MEHQDIWDYINFPEDDDSDYENEENETDRASDGRESDAIIADNYPNNPSIHLSQSAL